MNVVLVTRQYWPAVGGVERVAENLGQALTARGHTVTVVAQSVDETHFGRLTHIIRERLRFAPFERDGIAVVQFRPSRARRALLLPFAAELIPFGGRLSRLWLRAHTAAYYASVVEPVLRPLLAGADIIHVLGGELLAVGAVETARRLGTPAVVSPFAHGEEWGMDSGSVRAYRRADVVIATTRADAEPYTAAGVSVDRIEIVPPPVPYAGPGPDAVRLEREARQAPTVVFLGQRRPTKRIERLLEAATQVWESRPETRFAFVGPGAPLPLRDERILDVGRVSDAERARWLARADLVCLPSSSESFGMVIAEAWSESVPVVVSDIPVLRELVEASGGGVVAGEKAGALAEAIVDLLDDPARAASLGAAGHTYWRRELTPEAVGDRHLSIYARLVRERTSS